MDLAAARARRRFAYLLGFIAVTVVVAAVWLRDLPLSPEWIRATVLSWGALAPVMYIGILAARPFVLFPSSLLFIAAGLAFGPLFGTLYAAIGGTAAAVLSFLLARWLGREFVQARLPARLRRFQESSEWGAGLIFVLNLVPIAPMTAVNYGAGLSRVSLGHYTLAVIGGLTPRAFAYTFVGDSLLDAGSSQFVMAVALLAGLILLPALARYWWLRRWRRPAPRSEEPPIGES